MTRRSFRSIFISLRGGEGHPRADSCASEDATPRSSVASAQMRARKRAALGCVAVAMGLLLTAAPAQAAFGLKDFDVTFTNADGSPAFLAGSHPFAMTTKLHFNTTTDPELGTIPDGSVKDVIAGQLPGLIGDNTAIPRCSTAEFLTIDLAKDRPACEDSTAVGINAAEIELQIGRNDPQLVHSPIYNLQPPPGVTAKLGFITLPGLPITIEVSPAPNPPFNLIATVSGISQAVPIYGSELTLWGNPGDPAHDPYRGHCIQSAFLGPIVSLGQCHAGNGEHAFLTLPRACTGPLRSTYLADSWQAPGARLPGVGPDLSDPNWLSGYAETHDGSGAPFGFSGCARLGLDGAITAKPTSRAASSPSGLDFSLDVADEGLSNPKGVAGSDIEKTVVTLPPGFSANPSLAEGLGVCTEADLARESAFSEPGAGCPDASKIGTVEVETPLLEESVKGALYIAKPYENPFHSLLALYIVLKSPELGISIIQPAKVTPDPLTGQLVTTTEDLPQLPFSHFKLHFREGARSPLATPPACGVYDGAETAPGVHNPEPVRATLYPSSGGAPAQTGAAFEIISGPGGGPCPAGGLPPFRPGLVAGTLNNAAGRFSPFNVRLSRTDSEQEFTHFSIKLPPGVAGKLAGIPFCSDAQIAAAQARTGPHGGAEELDSPSCPAASQVGRTLAGAGVGPSLAYAPGKLYLAGPYHGHPVSIVSITAGVVGPFDIGTVVVRLALDVNPETGEVFLDSTGSDPLPHIVKGIPVHLRDVRAYTDRPEFTFNPTSCERTSTSSTVLGSGLDFVSAADDNPFVATSPFQAADCAALPFKPKLTLKLMGSHKRTGNPALQAHLAMNGFGEAGLAYAQVALPKSLFLDNSHINTICTRVQFKQGALEGEKCPPGSIIGSAKATTPILDGALEGPIYLRSSEHQLPDIAAALHGQEINVVAVGHTDSAPGGGLRNTFEVIPDAPISTVDINLFGGKRGLILNSQDLCKSKPKAKVKFKGHNGKLYQPKVAIQPSGCKKAKKKSKRHARRS